MPSDHFIASNPSILAFGSRKQNKLSTKKHRPKYIHWKDDNAYSNLHQASLQSVKEKLESVLSISSQSPYLQKPSEEALEDFSDFARHHFMAYWVNPKEQESSAQNFNHIRQEDFKTLYQTAKQNVYTLSTLLKAVQTLKQTYVTPELITQWTKDIEEQEAEGEKPEKTDFAQHFFQEPETRIDYLRLIPSRQIQEDFNHALSAFLFQQDTHHTPDSLRNLDETQKAAFCDRLNACTQDFFEDNYNHTIRQLFSTFLKENHALLENLREDRFGQLELEIRKSLRFSPLPKHGEASLPDLNMSIRQYAGLLSNWKRNPVTPTQLSLKAKESRELQMLYQLSKINLFVFAPLLSTIYLPRPKTLAWRPTSKQVVEDFTRAFKKYVLPYQPPEGQEWASEKRFAQTLDWLLTNCGLEIREPRYRFETLLHRRLINNIYEKEMLPWDPTDPFRE